MPALRMRSVSKKLVMTRVERCSTVKTKGEGLAFMPRHNPNLGRPPSGPEPELCFLKTKTIEGRETNDAPPRR